MDELENISREIEFVEKSIAEFTQRAKDLRRLLEKKKAYLREAVRRRIIAAVVETGPETGKYYYVNVDVPLDKTRYTAIVHTLVSPTVRVMKMEPLTSAPPSVWIKPESDKTHVTIFNPMSTDTATTQLVNIDGYIEERLVTHGN